MDYRILIDKFFQGTTSHDEEEMLRRYLMGNVLPADILKDRELLLAMLQPSRYDCCEAMDGISAMVDELAAGEELAVSQKPVLRKTVFRYVCSAMTAAAAIALLFVVFPYSETDVTGMQEQKTAYRNDTFSNPEDVAEHIEGLLAIFSDAAVHGIREQEAQLKQFVVLNNAIY